MRITLLIITFLFLLNPTISLCQRDTASIKLSIIGVGDIMMGTDFPSNNTLPSDSGKNLFDSVKQILTSADIVVGNLEGVLSDKGTPVKNCNDSLICYYFKTPENYAQNLKDAGFNFLSIANNHSNDFGLEARKRTIKALKKFDLSPAGALFYPTSVIEKNGIKYGFAAFSFNNDNCNINDTASVTKIIKELSSLVDIVIVSFHGGGESVSFQHTKNITEFYLGENRGNPIKFSRLAIDSGADVVFGHGPHVPRALELYNKRLIAYSLGNFCTYRGISIAGEAGIAPILKVILNKSGEFIGGEIIPVIQLKHGFPVLDKKKRAIKSIKKLTEEDFPNSQLKINDDGKIFNESM